MSLANGIDPTTGNALVNVVTRCLVTAFASLKLLFLPVRGHPVHVGLRSYRPVGIAAGLIFAGLLLGMVLIDAGVANSVKNAPRWIVSVFRELTDFGKGAWFAWPTGILFLILAAMPRTLSPISQRVLAAVMVRVGFLFVAIGLPGLFASLVKNMIGRRRPPLDTVMADPFVFDPFHWAPAYASLPSGHATTAFAAFAAISMLWPRMRPIMLVYALAIALSRVLVTAHYFTDVAAGAVVGIVGAMLVRRWFAARRLGFSIGPDGALHQLPGPSLKRIKSVARELLA